MAVALNVHTTLVSQIFRGNKSLSMDQAMALADYLGLSELETEYFLLLVQLDRAATDKLKSHLKKQLKRKREEGLELSHHLAKDTQLSDVDKSIFYSSWIYSALRVLTSLNSHQNIEDLAKHLDLPKAMVSNAMEFLVSRNLCISERGKFKPGHQRTHLESTSPLIARHHTNWRLKAIENFDVISSHELVYTAPLSISQKDAAAFRQKLVKLISELGGTVKDTDPESFYCFNIDWLEL